MVLPSKGTFGLGGIRNSRVLLPLAHLSSYAGGCELCPHSFAMALHTSSLKKVVLKRAHNLLGWSHLRGFEKGFVQSNSSIFVHLGFVDLIEEDIQQVTRICEDLILQSKARLGNMVTYMLQLAKDTLCSRALMKDLPSLQPCGACNKELALVLFQESILELFFLCTILVHGKLQSFQGSEPHFVFKNPVLVI